MDKATFGRRLRHARAYLGLTQEEVAAVLEVPRSAVSEWERGHRDVSATELVTLANLYKVSVALLVDETAEASLLDNLDAHMRRLFRVWPCLDAKDRLTVLRFARFLHYAGRVPPHEAEED